MTERKEPAVSWTPIEMKPDRGEKSRPRINIEWQKGIEVDKQVEETGIKLIQDAIKYLEGLYGDGYPTPPQFLVEMTKRDRHAAQGALIKLAIESISRFDELEQEQQDQERSLIVHEVVHNLRDEEDLSMLAELIFMLERGHTWRLTKLSDIRSEGRLPPAYEISLSTIAQWLETTVDQLLDTNKPKDTRRMQEIFRREVKSIVKDAEIKE